jgi:terminase large subunit-like protein
MQYECYYTLGLDLGKARDPTALAVIETDPSTSNLQLRDLYRFDLGTPYSDVLLRLGQRLDKPPLLDRARLAVDASGLGAPFVDLFRRELPDVDLYAITITSGSTSHGKRRNPRVPKHELVATTSLILEQGRLRIAAEMPETPTLIDELLSYHHDLTEHGNDTYSAGAGQHDDLVIALSLALWLALNRRIRNPNQVSVAWDRGSIPGIVAMGEGVDF